MILMLEKMKKFASAARMREAMMSNQILGESCEREASEFLSMKINGKRSTAVSSESIKRSAKGEVPLRTFWSIVYTSPHVTAAAVAHKNPFDMR